MWKDLKMKNVDGIDRTVAEFTVWMHSILPYGKMKVKISESQDGRFEGITDIQLIRKFDGYGESAVGRGKTIEEVLEDTIKNFNEMVEQDYPDMEEGGLKETDICYSEWSDF